MHRRVCVRVVGVGTGAVVVGRRGRVGLVGVVRVAMVVGVRRAVVTVTVTVTMTAVTVAVCVTCVGRHTVLMVVMVYFKL